MLLQQQQQNDYVQHSCRSESNRIESNRIALPDIIIDPNQYNLYYMTLVTVTFMKKSEIEEEQRKIKIKDMG